MLLPRGHLGFVHQATVIVLVACDRCSPAFDRVGDETGASINGVEGVGHCLNTVAAKVFHQVSQLFVCATLDEAVTSP